MDEIVKVELTMTKIKIRVPSSQWDPYARAIAGKIDDKVVGEYVYSMSTQNLEKLFKVFDGNGVPKAVVVSGEKCLEAMREKWRNYQGAKRQMRDIMKLERYPVEPNGKFVPFSHQTKIIGTMLAHPYPPTFVDCGTGKSGASLRSIELLLKDKKIMPGKVLISAPLSILEAAWVKDLKSFTDLTYKMLWTTVSNKTIRRGDPTFIRDFGAPPVGHLTTKTKKAMRWVKGQELRDGKLDIFSQAEGGWTKMEIKYKEATLLDGTKVPFGPVTGQVVEKENTRENWIQEALKEKVDVFIINHDGVRIYEDILKQHQFEMVVVDESTKIKSIQSLVTQAHVEISWHAKRRVILSGTPNPNGFLDLWSQYYFLDRGLTLYSSLKDFRHAYFDAVSIGHFGGNDAVKWEMKLDRRQELIDKIKDSAIFIKQRDCVDLPPRTDLNREIVMTSEQSKVYTEMEEQLVTEFMCQKTGTNVMVEAVNILSKLMRLRQITSGFIGHEPGKVAAITTTTENPKFLELDEFIEELHGEKVVLVCQFKEEIHSLLTRYRGKYGIAAIYGDEPLARRTENINKFQTTSDLQIMILQPQAAAHGITLTEAHYLVFLSLDYNFEYYYQVGKRIERIGQKSAMFVYHFLAKTDEGNQTIDHDLMWVLKDKAADRDALFNDSTPF